MLGIIHICYFNKDTLSSLSRTLLAICNTNVKLNVQYHNPGISSVHINYVCVFIKCIN